MSKIKASLIGVAFYPGENNADGNNVILDQFITYSIYIGKFVVSY